MKTDIQTIKHLQKKDSERGLTLMEALVAVLMVSAVLVAITPPIFLTVATRVQNRKAEQALQLAHGEIDQVRVLVQEGITGGPKGSVNQLPKLASGVTTIAEVEPPTSKDGRLQSTNYECSKYDQANAPQLDVTTARQVDVNGDCLADFLVQTFRSNEQNILREGLPVPVVFRVGVRVYSISAKFEGLETGQASLQLTTGEGQQTKRPLAVMYTVLGQGDSGDALEKYRCFAGSEGVDCE
jgi:type II secretory pathway pseudopilin PulG